MNVNLAHDHSKAHFLRAAPKNDGAECSFVNAFKVHAGVDTGILECNVEETCIEDNTSTLGGRCFMLDKEEFVDMEIPHTASDSPFLTIPCSFINGTSAFKCVGQDACLGVNDFDAIGCGSCIGMFSCKEVAASVIGENSCNGFGACNKHEQSVGHNSCHGYYACGNTGTTRQNHVVVGDCLCNVRYSCSNNPPNNLNFNNCTTSSSAPTTSPSVSPSLSPTSSPNVPPSALPSVSPAASPSKWPSAGPSHSPSKSPSVNSTSPCFPRARQVKLQSLTGLPIQVFEVHAYSLGNNVAAGKVATQSSMYNGNSKHLAGNAVDGNENTFSHTAVTDKASWWEVDLGGMFPIESVKIVNRWCKSSSDPADCLGRLSHSALVLFDNEGKWVGTTLLGEMSGVHEFEHEFTSSAKYCTGA
ncbi:hypothetical protein HJC23_005820 [Cyclotella cryptica]|uniref:DUF7640 domain-containing protein n=1 Tax=Cyclotella cryptica TaxID=29204 RepID=A0ABD3R0L9_9STRA